MRKTAAYLASLIFLFFAGLAILHPAYESLSAWLSPLTGSSIYTLFMCFTLLIADPIKYAGVGITWLSAGILIGLISQKKLGASITAFFTWFSMIPTMAVSVFGIYSNLEAAGIFTIDDVDSIINVIPNIPESMSLTSLLELPIVSEIALTVMEVIPTMGENTEPMSVVMSVATPYITAVALKPALIIVGAIVGAIVGKLIANQIDIELPFGKKTVSAVVLTLILTQLIAAPLIHGQEFNISEIDPELIAEIGIDPETLQELMEMDIDPENFDLDTLSELGIDLESLNLEALSELGVDLGLDLGLGDGLDINPLDTINLMDGIYLEAIGAFIENQGRAVTAEILVGTEIQPVPPTSPYLRDLAASVILTQKVFDQSVLYTLPIEGIENYIQLTGIVPNTVAVNLYVDEDVEAAETKSDSLVTEYENLYGIQFTKIATQPITFTSDEGAEMEIPSYVACAYVSLNPLEETIPNLLTGFEPMGGLVDTFQERIEGDRQDVEIYVTGRITPEYLQAFIPVPEVPVFLESIVESLFAETYHMALGIQLTGEGITGSGDTFDLRDTLGVDIPSYSSNADFSLIALARQNTDEPEADIKVATSLAQDSAELMFLSMYINSMIEADLSGGSSLTSSDLQINVPEYVPANVEVTKMRQGNTVTITVTNEGSVSISDVTIVDPFPIKYGILATGSNEETWARLSPGETATLTYEMNVENPGVYTDLPALLYYETNDATVALASNTMLTISKPPGALSLLIDNYRVTIDLLDMTTGNGSLVSIIPIAFILLIAAIDVFKMVRNRSKSSVDPAEGPLPDPPEPEDSPGDPL